MKVHVIVDVHGNIMGALAKGRRTEDAEEVVLRAAHPDHRLHEPVKKKEGDGDAHFP